MFASVRRSASAAAAMATNSLPRLLIFITDMPAECLLNSSHLAFSSTSTGIVAGPAPKLKMRDAGLICGAAAIGASVRRGLVAGGGILRRIGDGGGRMGSAIAVAVLAVLLVAVHDALHAAE